MNIVLTIMAGGRYPVRVAVKQVGEEFYARTMGNQPVEAWDVTFNGVIAKIDRRAAHAADNEAA